MCLVRIIKKVIAGLAIVGALFLIAQILQRSNAVVLGKVPEFRKKGNPKAKVVIVEYSDFQCPACKAAQATLEPIFQDYQDKILIVFKHTPLERVHKWARKSAHAAECAGKQNKFWQFHDMLYGRQKDWEKLGTVNEVFLSYAKEIGLNLDQWTTCLQDPAIDETISQDIHESDVRQVESTPTFFVDNMRLVGGEQLRQHGRRLIEIELKR